MYRKYAFFEASQALAADERGYYVRVRYGREQCIYDDLIMGLGALTDMLYKHYGTKPIILIDEYDAPIQHAWAADCEICATFFNICYNSCIGKKN